MLGGKRVITLRRARQGPTNWEELGPCRLRSGKNIEITKALREYVEKKLGKIEKFVDHPIKAQANLYVEHGRHIIEVTAELNGWILRGEEATNDMYASIDLVADKLEKQVQRYPPGSAGARGRVRPRPPWPQPGRRTWTPNWTARWSRPSGSP